MVTDTAFAPDRARAVFRFAAHARRIGPTSMGPDVREGALAELIDEVFAAWLAGISARTLRAELELRNAGFVDVLDQPLFSPRFFAWLPAPIASSHGLARQPYDLSESRLPDRLLGFYGSSPETAITLGDLAFETGSLTAKGVLKMAGGGLFALALALAPFAAERTWNDRDWNGQITRILEGQLCEATLSGEVDINALRALAADSLVRHAGQSHEERRVRRCITQVLLRLNGFQPGPIDGVYGPQTKKAMAKFAADHGLTSAEINDPRFYSALIDGVQRKH